MSVIVSSLRTIIREGVNVDTFLNACTLDIIRRGSASRILQAIREADLDEADRANEELTRALAKLEGICSNLILYM